MEDAAESSARRATTQSTQDAAQDAANGGPYRAGQCSQCRSGSRSGQGSADAADLCCYARRLLAAGELLVQERVTNDDGTQPRSDKPALAPEELAGL